MHTHLTDVDWLNFVVDLQCTSTKVRFRFTDVISCVVGNTAFLIQNFALSIPIYIPSVDLQRRIMDEYC